MNTTHYAQKNVL